jgi:hypothetical protein
VRAARGLRREPAWHALSGQLPEPVPPVAPLLPGASRACWPCSLRESDRWPPGHRSSARARPLWFAASVLGPASRAGPAPAARCAVPCGAAGTPQPRWGGALPVVKLKPRNLRRDGRSTPGVPMAACCHGVAALLAVFTRSWRRLVTKPVTLVITRSPARQAHRMRTARYAVWVFGGVLALVAGLQPQIDRLVSTALTAFFSQSDDWIAANTSLASVGLVLLTTVVMFVAFLFFLRDSAPLGRIALDPLVRD